MAKLTILAAAALLALLALAQATQTITTTTTAAVEEEANPGRCREQIRRQQNLRHCQMHLEEMAGGGGGRAPNTHHIRQCCQQLENLDRQCRCEGLRGAVRLQGEVQGEEMRREMMEEAENLPSMCNLSPRRCQMTATS